MLSIRGAIAVLSVTVLSATASFAEGNYYFGYNSHTYDLWNKYETCENELGSNCVKAIQCGTSFYGHKNTRGMVETIQSRGEEVSIRENWGSFAFVARC